jgi:hypothetical protein
VAVKGFHGPPPVAVIERRPSMRPGTVTRSPTGPPAAPTGTRAAPPP